jgi:hypothetical protein
MERNAKWRIASLEAEVAQLKRGVGVGGGKLVGAGVQLAVALDQQLRCDRVLGFRF